MELVTEIQNISNSTGLNVYFHKELNSCVIATSCGPMSFAYGIDGNQTRQMIEALIKVADMIDESKKNPAQGPGESGSEQIQQETGAVYTKDEK
jgi:hypothetical protein